MRASRRTAGLVLQGGGARGAYQVGALKAIAQLAVGCDNPFRIISGASVGALNAAALAAGAEDFTLAANRLEAMWRGLDSAAVFDTSAQAMAITGLRVLQAVMFGRLGAQAPNALLDNTPLRRLLEREVTRERLEHAIGCGAVDALCITAASYGTSRAVTFFEARNGIDSWRRARRDGVRTRLTTDHLMASSALPLAFAPVRIGNDWYGDGALRLTSPLSPAIRAGADRVLVIGVRDGAVKEADENTIATTAIPPSLGDIGGHALDILFNDNLEADVERMTRVNATLALLTPQALERSPLRMIDVLTLVPSEDLRDIADRHLHEMPRSVRLLLGRLGATRGRLPSYLLFEPGYIDALIDLGFRDSMARTAELEAFLVECNAPVTDVRIGGVQ